MSDAGVLVLLEGTGGCSMVCSLKLYSTFGVILATCYMFPLRNAILNHDSAVTPLDDF